jgi:murein L,D-transpeptidase YcbB/YkuD
MAVPVGLDGLKMTKSAQQAIDKAKEMGLTITSAYRSPEHDKQVGGTGTGYHVLGQALDVAGKWDKMDAYAKWAKSSGLFRSVLWQVAGHYNHVHVSWTASAGDFLKGDSGDNTISIGESGAIVVAIQKLLGGLNNKGYFGPATKEAVQEFQKNRGLEADGIVGKKTWEKLTGGGASFFS